MKGAFFMGKGKVDISGVNTANIKVLSNKEMNDLFFRLSCGDKSAKEELVNGNLKLVLSLLKKFNNRTAYVLNLTPCDKSKLSMALIRPIHPI